jgi:hypothetical protein
MLVNYSFTIDRYCRQYMVLQGRSVRLGRGIFSLGSQNPNTSLISLTTLCVSLFHANCQLVEVVFSITCLRLKSSVFAKDTLNQKYPSYDLSLIAIRYFFRMWKYGFCNADTWSSRRAGFCWQEIDINASHVATKTINGYYSGHGIRKVML